MTVLKFPNVELADDESGLLAVGGDLDVESLILAYSSGIFPWPVVNDELTWFAPKKRTVLFLDKLKIARSLKKFYLHNNYTFAFDRNFPAVIRACSEVINRGDQEGTWITPDIIQAYIKLHEAGYVHSAECYEGDTLIGGLYGVSIGSMFAGESMFYRKSNASKCAFLFLCSHLRERGAKWIDCQVMTDLLRSFGAEEIERKDFMQLLQQSIQEKIRLFP